MMDTQQTGGDPRLPLLVGMLLVCLALAVFSVLAARAGKKRRVAAYRTVSRILAAALIPGLAITLICGAQYLRAPRAPALSVPTEGPRPTSTGPSASTPEATTLPPETEPPVTEPPVTEPPEVEYLKNFHPYRTDATDPANWGVTWEIFVGKEKVDSYSRETPISMGQGPDYYPFEGVCTFRGNNFRTSAAYGTVEIGQGTLNKAWSVGTGSIGEWTGSGWTGQPLITRWDPETRAIMNLYEDKKAKDGLVEVIYATLDGHIYFLDADDGSRTRDPIRIGMCMKGAGALDPRGYPMMYVGTGDFLDGKPPRMYVISLIDGSILYEGGFYDPNALRSWCAFDSSPLVCAQADTLIWPGENGILYTIKLNTAFDKAAGTLSIDPEEPVKARYNLTRATGSRYWIGMENSCVVVGSYLFVADNAGMFFCVDLNTMELVWAQDTKDDNNATPVFQWGPDGNGYLYTAPSLHWTADGNHHGTVSIYKLDARTGEILWEKPFECDTISGTSGGVQSSPALGRQGSDLDGLIFFSVSYTPRYAQGLLVALDTETGETVWELKMDSYSWCSPVAVYDADNKGYLLMPSFYGTLYLIEGATGKVLGTGNLRSHMEASPAVFENRLIIGTRSCTIQCFEIG